MRTLSNFSTGRNVIILLALFLFANFVLIPAIYPKFETLDTMSAYSPEEAYNLFSNYGESGRNYYIIIELTLDIIYPLITALLFSLSTLYTFQRAFPGKSGIHNLAVIPFGVMLADYLENFCIVLMLLNYPRELTNLARLSNIFTNIKFVLSPVELLLVIIGLIGWLIQFIRTKRKK